MSGAEKLSISTFGMEFEIDGVWKALWKYGSACSLEGQFAGWEIDKAGKDRRKVKAQMGTAERQVRPYGLAGQEYKKELYKQFLFMCS